MNVLLSLSQRFFAWTLKIKSAWFKIIFLLSFCFSSLAVQTKPLQTLNITKKPAQVVLLEEQKSANRVTGHTSISQDQLTKEPQLKQGQKGEDNRLSQTSTMPKGTLRNAFMELSAEAQYVFRFEDYFLKSTFYYGEVLKGWPRHLAPGHMEQKFGVSASFFSKDNWSWYLESVSEFNFIKNDGINNYIPGIALPLSVSYGKDKKPPPLEELLFIQSTKTKLSFNIGLSVFLKIFISQNWALIPEITAYVHYFSVTLENQRTDLERNRVGDFAVIRDNTSSIKDSSSTYSEKDLSLVFKLSLRRYF